MKAYMFIRYYNNGYNSVLSSNNIRLESFITYIIYIYISKT